MTSDFVGPVGTLMDRLIEFLAAVPERRWCVTKWCTTCGHQSFAKALVRLEEPPSITIETLMANVSFEDFAGLPNWSDYLASVFARRRGPMKRGLLSGLERERVLLCWHDRLVKTQTIDAYFVDHVLFYPVRGLRTDSEAVQPWFELGVRVLRNTQDQSLAETMVYLGGRHPRFKAEILELINDLKLDSVAIRHAFTQVQYTR